MPRAEPNGVAVVSSPPARPCSDPVTPSVAAMASGPWARAKARPDRSDGPVERTVHPVVPPRVEYESTFPGRTLHSTVQSLVTWTERHQAEIAAARTACDGLVAEDTGTTAP